MTRTIILSALTTGAFCAVFASVVDMITDALDMWEVALAGGISGACGSLFASLVWKKK